tara:strand:+ start:307 stop:3051 length:2745 start_codon:yes stop_codon:yes gene_type:complete
MSRTLTSNPELFSNLSWDLLLLGEETAKKWGHAELNIEHIIQTLFTANEFANFIEKLSIDQNVVLDITEDFLEETPLNESDNLTIGEDLEILLDNANHIKIQWGSKLIEIPHLLIAIARDERLGYYVFEEGNLSIDKLEAELRTRPTVPKSENNDPLKNRTISNPIISSKNINQNNFGETKSTKVILPTQNDSNLDSLSEINEESALALYGKDLTEEARLGHLDPVIGREIEINNLMRVLSRRNKNNPILIGQPGVGKTAITQLLAQLIAQEKVPDSLKNAKIISLNFGALVSGTKFRGQLEERLRSILDELKDPDQGVILFIDEIHTILTSERSTIDISSMLKPLLTGGDLRCIGSTTPERFRESIEKDQALNNCFQKIFVNEPTLEVSSKILNRIKRKYEIHHGIKITKEAIDYAAKLSSRYISDKYLPDKAIDLIDEAAAQLKIESSLKPIILVETEKKLEAKNYAINELSYEDYDKENELLTEKEFLSNKLTEIKTSWLKERKNLSNLISLFSEEEKCIKQIEGISKDVINIDADKFEKYLSEIRNNIRSINEEFNLLKANKQLIMKYEVGPDDIADVVAKMTGIPVSKVVSNERKKLINLEKEISQKVIGQDKAITAISAAIRRARAGMKNPKRPIGSFLFMGPTGVGKTELAKSLASSLFDEEEALLRLDMSEYMERNAVARLLGAPPGYVGYEEGGQLTEAVKRKPYSVILLDEIEKAHGEVFNILLQVLDEGRLTDSQGSTIDFKNTVIIMTSNIAGKAILENQIKSTKSDLNQKLSNENLEKSISESLSSIFRPEFLNRIDEVIKFNPLSEEQLEKIVLLQIEDLKVLLLEQDIQIKIDKKVVIKIAKDSYEPQYGARSINRELRRQIENPLATKLLENNFNNKKMISIKIDPKNKDSLLFTPSS